MPRGLWGWAPSPRWGAYLFATFEALAAEDVAGHGRTTLDVEEVSLMPEEVWAEVPESDGAA